MATATKDEQLAEQEQARQESLAEERASSSYSQRVAAQLRQRLKQKIKQEVKKRIKKKVKRKVERAAARTFFQLFLANQWWLIWVELGLLIAFLIFLTIFAICTSKNVLVQAGVWLAGFNDLCSAFRQ